MRSRIQRLKQLIDELKSDAYSDQYGIADAVEHNEEAMDEMNKLCHETELYVELEKKIQLKEHEL